MARARKTNVIEVRILVNICEADKDIYDLITAKINVSCNFGLLMGNKIKLLKSPPLPFPPCLPSNKFLSLYLPLLAPWLLVCYKTSLRTSLFRLEDIYIVGFCGQRVGVNVVEDSRFNLSTHYNGCVHARYASGHRYTPAIMYQVYRTFQNRSLCENS
ncbi:hexosyltransferase [Plakobranchus ocellatus]|uniref:Hexosyltransferase n=1 Tax=Plakobranchus ocellatus TaxID=259542 RepID=A0AAV3XZN1_9GAST|nr:hexosyltransferase [Plakobranchus ocellatus]